MNQKKKGFTLIELLAVIVILAIIAVIAVPIITNLMYKARKSLLKSTAYSYIQAADNKCFKEQLDGENGSFTYTSEDGVITSIDNINDYIKGKEPDKVQLSTTDECASTLAIYDKSLGVCAYKDYDMEEVLLANIADGTKCEIGKEIKDDSAPIFTGYACSNPGDIEVTEEKYFTFNLSTGEITGYSSEGPKDVVIPCQIGGKNVVYIGNSAFESKSLTSVIMPDTVKSIGEKAFYSNSITTLELGNSVESIDRMAFAGNDLTEVVFPDSLKSISGPAFSIDSGVFEGNNLTKVVFGSGIQSIGKRAFLGASRGNRIVELDLSRATNLKTIAANAFENNLISNLDLLGATSLTTISEKSFYNNKLTSLDIPTNVKTIGANAFASNPDLSEIFIHGKVDSTNFTSLGSTWNGNCTNIIYELNSCYTYSGNTITGYASSCSKKITIPTELDGNTITAIGENAFYNVGLTSVTIPKTVMIIGDNAFGNNSSLSNITVIGKTSESDFTSLGTLWYGTCTNITYGG